MEQYVNIMLDRGFKAVFGNKQVAIDFINAALEGERQVKDLTYLDKEILPESLDQRTVIFDCLCEDVDGTKFILETTEYPSEILFRQGVILCLFCYPATGYLCQGTVGTSAGIGGKEWG